VEQRVLDHEAWAVGRTPGTLRLREGGNALVGVTLVGRNLHLANFQHARLHRVLFVGCTLSDAAFGGAYLQGAAFVDCDWPAAYLDDCTVDGSVLECWRADYPKLRNPVCGDDVRTALALAGWLA
jgi:uncharacterized protein YjbI with pentapeptide repeats